MYSEPSFPRGGTLKRVKNEKESENKEVVRVSTKIYHFITLK